MDNEYDEFNLGEFDGAFAPAQTPTRLENLVPGDYSGTIQTARLERATNGATVVKWILFVLDGPSAVRQVVEHTSWLTDVAAVGRFGGELLTLGVDTASWVPPDRSFSQMLPAALSKLAGKPVQFGVSTWMDKKSGKMRNQLRFSATAKPWRGGQDRDQMPDQSALPF